MKIGRIIILSLLAACLFGGAQASAEPPLFSVTYNGNGHNVGDVPEDPNSPYPGGSEVTVLGTGTMARTGYTFGRWNTMPDSSGESYAEGHTFVISADVTLYAQWTVNEYTVTLDPQEGTGGTESVLATFDAPMPAATAPKRADYLFAGYYTAVDGGGARYYTAAMDSARNWDIAADTTLYAWWSTAEDGDGKWDLPTDGSWDASGNWVAGTIASGADRTALFGTFDDNSTVTVDSEGRTIGHIAYNPTNSNRLTIDGNALTMRVTPPEDPEDPPNRPSLTTVENRGLLIFCDIAGVDGLVVEGGGAGGGVALRGNNTFTGGIFLNSGSLGYNVPGTDVTRTTTAGLNNNPITVSGTSFAQFENGTLVNGGVHITEGSEFRAGTNNNNFSITGALTGSGILTHQQYGLGNQTINLLSHENTFAGRLDYDMPRSARFVVNSLSDAEGSGNIRFGVTSPFQANRQHIFEFGSGAIAPLTFDNRRFEILGSMDVGAYEIRSSNVDHALTINSDPIVGHTGLQLALWFSGVSSEDNTFAGQITDGPGDGENPSVLGIEKRDRGTWILAGNNTYTGSTTITGGTLLINGDQSAATGDIFVQGTSTLGGSGTIGGDVRLTADAHLAPGASVGTLTILGELDLRAMAGGDGRLIFDLGPIAASDRIVVGGPMIIGNGVLGFSDFALNELGGMQAGTYTLVSSGDIVGTLDPADLTGEIGGWEATLEILDSDLLLVVVGDPPPVDPYEAWANGEAFDDDTSGDGIANGLAWVLGAEGPEDDARGMVPKVRLGEDEGEELLIFTFRRLREANEDENTEIDVEYSTDLTDPEGWEVAADNDDGIEVDVVADGDVDIVTVRFKTSEIAPDGRLFVRLRVERIDGSGGDPFAF